MKKSSGSNKTGETRGEIKAREHFQKVVAERISLVEKYFAMLSKDVGNYATALESIREKGAKLSVTIDNYAEEEYPSTKECLTAVAENFATVQDYAGAQVDFLQAKVIQPLSLYTTNCKLTKDYMKGMTTARDKEIAKYKVVEKLKAKEPSHSKKLSQAEQELQKVSVDANRARQTLEEQMVAFEKKRIQDIKTILGNFFHGQMLYHAKALETYTKAYQNLMAVDEENDLEAFENALRPHTSNRLDVVRTGSQTSLNRFSSQGSLGSQLSLNRTVQSLGTTGGLQDVDDDSDFD